MDCQTWKLVCSAVNQKKLLSRDSSKDCIEHISELYNCEVITKYGEISLNGRIKVHIASTNGLPSGWEMQWCLVRYRCLV